MEDRTALLRRECAAAVQGQVKRLDVLRKQNVLMTGGTGFLGSWIALLLTTLNDEFGFGTKTYLLSPRADESTLAVDFLPNRKDVVFLNQDVRHLRELPGEIHWLIHAAANPDNRFHSSNPVRTMETVLQGTHAVLTAAERLAELRMVLNVSSGLVYGGQGGGETPLTEKSFGPLDCLATTACYAEAKRAAESLASAFRTQRGLPILTARPFTFMGPFQHLDRPWAINNFIRDALRGGPIRVLGSGETVRSFMYGADAAVWFLRILTGGRAGGAYNVGSPDGIKLKDLAAKIAEMNRNQIAVEFNTAVGGRPPVTHWVPDVSMATQELGLTSTVPLDAALKRTVAWAQM